MLKIHHIPVLFFLLLTMGTVSGAQNPTYAVGDIFKSITLPDQHGEEITVAEDAQLILFAADKEAAELVNEFLADRKETYLDQNRSYFLSDISAMPGMITRMFALPKMRERPYPILLAHEAETLELLPRQPGQVSVVALENQRVSSIRYASNKQQLQQLLDK